MAALALPWEETLAEADRLEHHDADPKRPYEFMYKARDVLRLLRDSPQLTRQKMAVLDYRLGKNFLDTEETHDAEKHLMLALATMLPGAWNKALRPNEETVGQHAAAKTLAGTADVDTTAEPTVSARSLAEHLDAMPPSHGFHKEAIDACNQTGILWTRRGQPQRALLVLDMALLLFGKWKGLFGGVGDAERDLVTDAEDAVETSTKTDLAAMENLNMHTLFFLAQVHGALGNGAESAKCCHRTLQMQHKTGQYDPVEWARNALSLAEHYMLSGEVEWAEHCLKAAMQIASEAPDPLAEVQARRKMAAAEASAKAVAATVAGRPDAEEQTSVANELLNQEGLGEMTEADKEYLFGHPLLKVQADVHRTWGKLLSATLEGAAENVVERRARGQPEGKGKTVAAGEKAERKLATSQLPASKKLVILTGKFVWKGRICPDIEEVYDFKTALGVFRRSRAEFEKSLEFYVLDGYVTDHITVQQEISKLYHHVAAFETSSKRIVAMENRRVALLSALADEINPEHYVLKTKELFYECAQASQEIHEAYYESSEVCMQVGERPRPKDMQKSDEALLRAIGYYEKFLSTMYKDGKHPEYIDKDNLPSVLGAHFAMARLYGHAYGGAAQNKQFRVHMLKAALDKHTWLVQFAERNIPGAIEALANDAMLEAGPAAAESVKAGGLFQAELALCKEMISLLPDRISQIYYGGT